MKGGCIGFFENQRREAISGFLQQGSAQPRRCHRDKDCGRALSNHTTTQQHSTGGTTLRQVANFIVSPSTGEFSVEKFFPGKTLADKTLVVDPAYRRYFERFMGGSEGTYQIGNAFRCIIWQTEDAENNDQFISSVLNVVDNIEPEELCAFLVFLGREAYSILDIPEGKDEVHLILGYFDVEEEETPIPDYKPFVVEHEFEHGVDSVHQHVYERDSWKQDEFPMVLTVVPA